METAMLLLLLEFLANHSARISYGNSWLVIDKDESEKYFYTVYNKQPYAKRSKKLYEGHQLGDALYCLENEEEYR